MSTNCGIAIKTEDGYECIYVHHDGYPEYMWPMLTENYNSEELAAKLVGMGDASYIAPNLDPKGPHSFEKPDFEVCCFYHRDRGESWDDVQPTHYEIYEGRRLMNEWWYLYIFDTGSGSWNFYEGSKLKNI